MDLNVNRNYKDSVFSKLFSSPELLRELYSAIEGIEVPKDAIVNINTLSDAIFMQKINDLSFTIDDRIVVLVEHQSTICENIPVRLLMYIGRVYEKIVKKENIYRKSLVKIPTPEFIVLYNGDDDYPDHSELRLSTAFKNVTGLKRNVNSELPLEVVIQVYNINQGRNPEMLKRSVTLDGYSVLIAKFNEYRKYFSLAEAARKAVLYCIEHNVLKPFLEEHSSEVVNMLYGDVTVEEIADIRAREALEIGMERGLEQGRGEGREEGRNDEKHIIARNLLAKGSTPEFVHEITGLSLDEIAKI